MVTAEEFFRNKIKEKNPNIAVVTLSRELITAEEGMRWAHEYAMQNDKANLGMAKTSELIYELSARCDTGSIDKGGNYRTVDND